ncbi:MAG: hypothetical protein ACSHX9_17085 [Luteolibacter sp.]
MASLAHAATKFAPAARTATLGEDATTATIPNDIHAYCFLLIDSNGYQHYSKVTQGNSSDCPTPFRSSAQPQGAAYAGE